MLLLAGGHEARDAGLAIVVQRRDGTGRLGSDATAADFRSATGPGGLFWSVAVEEGELAKHAGEFEESLRLGGALDQRELKVAITCVLVEAHDQAQADYVDELETAEVEHDAAKPRDGQLVELTAKRVSCDKVKLADGCYPNCVALVVDLDAKRLAIPGDIGER